MDTEATCNPSQGYAPMTLYHVPTYKDTEAIYNPSQDYAPMSAPPDRSHQDTPVDIACNLPVSSTPTGIPSTLTVPSPASSNDSESPERFPCPHPSCSKLFAQNRAAWRHFRERHDPDPCYVASCDFKWGRKYVYNNHLKKKHRLGNVDISTIMKLNYSHSRAQYHRIRSIKGLLPVLQALYKSY